MSDKLFDIIKDLINCDGAMSAASKWRNKLGAISGGSSKGFGGQYTFQIHYESQIKIVKYYHEEGLFLHLDLSKLLNLKLPTNAPLI